MTASLNPDRFWSKVDRRGPDECWLWLASTRARYGQISTRHGKPPARAHRVALEVKLGRSLLPGMDACHTCDHPLCVNPNHLFEGTAGDNLRDASRKGRLNPKSLLNLIAGRPGHRGARRIT
jgi:hypothetical protein